MAKIKTVIGNPARKDRFFRRDKIRNKIKDRLEGDSNLLISAPRRIGKTSIIYNLYDEPFEGYYPIFIEVESITDSNTFFEEIIDKVFNLDKIENFGGVTRKSLKTIKAFISKIKKINIDVKGEFALEVKDEKPIDYYEELYKFLCELDLEGLKILLLIDEFPVAVENISNSKGKEEAILFLKKNRRLRQDHNTSEKIQFIYTGSIGLYSVVKNLGATGEINDLQEIRIQQLTISSAKELTAALLHDINQEEIDIEYLLEKIEWRIPFYIQLMADEIKDKKDEKPELKGRELIEEAFTELLDHVNIYFDHFRTRLNKILNQNELNFAKEILAEISANGTIHSSQIPEISAKHSVMEERMRIIEILKYDGYINNNDVKEIYRFNSPIMREWWLKNVA